MAKNTAQLMEFNDKLKGLQLGMQSLSSNTFDSISMKYKTIEMVDLIAFPSLTNDNLKKIATNFPSLRCLDIRDCNNVSDLGVEYICRECQDLSEL